MDRERKLIVYIAASLDGYIAKPGGNLSFFTPYHPTFFSNFAHKSSY
jgi:hypothetical protein